MTLPQYVYFSLDRIDRNLSFLKIYEYLLVTHVLVSTPTYIPSFIGSTPTSIPSFSDGGETAVSPENQDKEKRQALPSFPYLPLSPSAL